MRLELKLEPDGELLQRQNPRDVMLIMVDYISCIDFPPNSAPSLENPTRLQSTAHGLISVW